MLKKLLIVFVGLLVILTVIGLLLPQKFEIHAERVIHATPEQIHATFADLRTWEEWTIWNGNVDPTCKWTYEGEPGKGMSMSWVGEELGSGKLTIDESSLEKGITYTMTMSEMTEPLTGRVTYEAVDGGTKVIWHDNGEMGVPVIGGYIVFAMSGIMNEMFETNLAQLDDRLHKQEGTDHKAVEASAPKTEKK